LEYYDTAVLSGIVKRSARILDVSIDRRRGDRIARRSRGHPRIVNACCAACAISPVVEGRGHIDLAITRSGTHSHSTSMRGGLTRWTTALLPNDHRTTFEPAGPGRLNTIATAVAKYEPERVEDGRTVPFLYY